MPCPTRLTTDITKCRKPNLKKFPKNSFGRSRKYAVRFTYSRPLGRGREVVDGAVGVARRRQGALVPRRDDGLVVLTVRTPATCNNTDNFQKTCPQRLNRTGSSNGGARAHRSRFHRRADRKNGAASRVGKGKAAPAAGKRGD